ncbi:hypothetical protein NHQ30_009390 [Ciborinia camelliae]|nr:hypothetical protein NHQ30_009390 [Ciborinia camelliae]
MISTELPKSPTEPQAQYIQEPPQVSRPQGLGVPRLTEYAKIFGPKSPGRTKSGLTPLDPLHPIDWANKSLDSRIISTLNLYQRNELISFTTRELKDLDAVCDRPLKESTLSGPIIPLLRRDRWEDKPSTAWLRTDSVPIKNDPFGGKWQSSNDKVWNTLRPIVVLASQYLVSSKSLPWFDAVLLGPRRWIIENRLPAGTRMRSEFHSYHSREGAWTAKREKEICDERDRIFDALMYQTDYTFTFFYSHENPRDNDPPNNDPSFPIKGFGDSLGITTINAWEMLFRKKPDSKMHGGIDQKRPHNHRSCRILASFVETNFPSFTTKSFSAASQPVLIDPPIHKHSDFYPLGVRFYEDLQNQDFWDLIVRSFGGGIFQYRTLKEGTRVTYDPQPNAPFAIRQRDRLDPTSHDPYQHEDVFFATSMLNINGQVTHTPEEKKLVAFGIKLTQSARSGRAFWETAEAEKQSVLQIVEILTRDNTGGVRQDWGLMATAVKDVVDLLVVASKIHERLVGLLLNRQRKEEEDNPGSIKGSLEDVTAKRGLLAWNMGTRAFNREVLGRFRKNYPEGELESKLNVSYNLLEKCRALLFVPEKKRGAVRGSKYPVEQREFDVLFDASVVINTDQDFVAGYKVCSMLVSNRYVGSFVKCAANLLISTCILSMAGGLEKVSLQDRYTSWRISRWAVERLVWLNEEISPVSAGWAELFEPYIPWGKWLVSGLSIDPRSVLPHRTEELQSRLSRRTAIAEGERLTQDKMGGAVFTDSRIGGTDARMEPRNMTRTEVEQVIQDEMEDVIFTDPQEAEEARVLRRSKRLQQGNQNPGFKAPE